jgi:putative peptide zinc metalloprotease protein
MTTDMPVKLAPGVHVVRRQAGLLLHCSRSGQTLRLSAAATPLVPGLQQGTSVEALVQCLHALHPQAQGVPQKVQAFLAPLAHHGMLAGHETAGPAGGRVWPPRHELLRSDAWLAPLVRCLAGWPAALRRGLWGGGTAAALAALLALLAAGRWPGLQATLTGFDPRGLLIFAAVVLAHELAHAVACRLAGAPVRSAGVVWHGGVLPGPYVDTSHASYLASRQARFMIPAAGPLVNLAGAGLCAAILLALPADAPAQAAWASAFVLCLAFVWFDLNPLVASDGSHMLEAVLDDELARQVALRAELATLTTPGTIRAYRLACVLWVTLMAGYFRWWW